MDQAATSLKPNILIAPLDWGLGHATRCIPIINALIQRNCRVFIACEGKTKLLLQKEFPQLGFIDLKGYRIHYSKKGWALPYIIGIQIPKILSTIQYENTLLKEIVKEYNIHGIISDNRYGFYHKSLPSVFITHQLKIKTPFGILADSVLQYLNYRYISRFSQCWIPDHENQGTLAGELSHSEKMPSIPAKYIGPLSRFGNSGSVQEKHLLVLISGPEPQRTLFENLLAEQLQEFTDPVVFIRGLPGASERLDLPENISVYNHLPAAELNQIMNETALVITRCGYSSIMDLARLQKKSILIPTPGQSEQAYLGKHLMKNNFALCIDQKKFRLRQALELASHFDYKFQHLHSGIQFNNTVDAFIAAAKSSRIPGPSGI